MTVAPHAHLDPDLVARAILAESAYRTAPRTSAVAPHPSLLSVLWEWFVDHVLARIFPPLAKAFAASQSFGSILGVAMVVAALAIVGFIAFRLAVAFAKPALAARGEALARHALGSPADCAQWRAAARAAAARGAYAEAIAALFRAALAALDESAAVAFDDARTPGEYRRAVRRARAAAAPPFDDLSDRFVRAAFAGAAPQRADYDAAERAFMAFEPALRA